MSFLENAILEKHYVKGEKLFDQGAVLEVVEVEKSLWSVMIKDKGILEVEIQNPNSKKQRSTCECNTFRDEKSCEHIATALLHLRKKESERAERRKRSALRRQTFNIKTVLETIDSEDLKKFVKTYAQTDRMFGVLLKASFARKIDLHDNSQKYESILSSLIKPISTERNASSTTDLRIALKVIEEFNSQLEDALSLNQFEEAFLIVESSLPKLHYLYSNYNKRSEKIIDLLIGFHGHIDLLYESQLAPALLNRLDEWMIALFQKSYYNHLDFLINLFHIAEKHERLAVVEKMKTIIKDTSHLKVKQINYVVFTALLIQNGFYEKVRTSDDTIIAAIQYLIKMDRGEKAIEYMERYRTSQSKNRKLEYTLATTYRSLGNMPKFHELSAELYVSNDDIRYYRMLKENSTPKSWAPVKKLILENIKTQKPNSSFIARFYEQEEMTDALITLLEDELDLRHIMKYDYALYKSHFVDIERIYHKAIKQYLENHAGHIATRFIDEILHHLTRIRAHKLTTSIKTFITKEFPHRHILLSFS